MNKSTILLSILLLLILSGCKDSSTSPLINFDIDPSFAGDVSVHYSPYNDPLDLTADTITADSIGNAVFNPVLPDGIHTFDATVLVGGINPDTHDMTSVEVHIEKGETLTVNIGIDAEGKPLVTFAGKNAAVSELLTTTANGFDSRSYFPTDINDFPPVANALTAIDNERRNLDPLVEAIADKDDREFYARLTDRRVDALKLMVMRIYSNVTCSDCDTVAEYRRIVESINPDDEADVRSDLFTTWLSINTPQRENQNAFDYSITEMQLIDSVMNNPVNRRIALSATANSFLSFVGLPKEELRKFNEAFSRYAANYPDLVEKTSIRINELSKVLGRGDRLPYDPNLETPDGGCIKLSELYGKVLYIDFWATWCGPCCGEIPYMEKLYKRLKDNSSVELISISLDENKAAWLDKLTEDQPDWLQCRLSADQNEKLSKVLNINGIPRFVIIDTDGKFISTYAPRPSDPEILDLLTSLIDKKLH